MNSQDTSAYWRKLLGMDEPLPADVLASYRPWQARLRPLFYSIVGLAYRHYCRVSVRGLENLPAAPPYIIAPNHASSIDFSVVAWALGRRRDELHALTTRLFYDILFTRFWIKVAANAVRIDTTADFFPALRAAARVLRAGGAVYINPEGLRSKDGTILPFRPGVGVLAVECGVPLVPVHIGGSWQALPVGSIFPRPRPITVSFGKPLEMTEYVRQKNERPAYEVYKSVAEELRRRVLETRSGGL